MVNVFLYATLTKTVKMDLHVMQNEFVSLIHNVLLVMYVLDGVNHKDQFLKNKRDKPPLFDSIAHSSHLVSTSLVLQFNCNLDPRSLHNKVLILKD